MLTGTQIIVLATPAFMGLILVEWLYGLWRGRNTYRLNDAINSLSCGLLGQIVNVLLRAFGVGIYTLTFSAIALIELPANAWWVWVFALIAYDFCYYWSHRFGHTVAVLWAAHAVHHQSEDYNLSTALRQTSTGWIFGWVFYLPMAVVGVPPVVFGTVALIDLLYQFWVHTAHVGKLGWFDRWFCSPSNHRVHHAVNERYLDKNFGGIWIIWDRLFGTYADEDDDEPCVYGTRKPLRTWNPVWANLDVYRDLLRDSYRTSAWRDKLRVWLMPPGWRPADVAQSEPRPAFALTSFQRFEPPLPRQGAIIGGLLFVLTLGAGLTLMWFAHTLPQESVVGGALMVVTACWVVGLLMSPPRGAT